MGQGDKARRARQEVGRDEKKHGAEGRKERRGDTAPRARKAGKARKAEKGRAEGSRQKAAGREQPFGKLPAAAHGTARTGGQSVVARSQFKILPPTEFVVTPPLEL